MSEVAAAFVFGEEIEEATAETPELLDRPFGSALIDAGTNLIMFFRLAYALISYQTQLLPKDQILSRRGHNETQSDQPAEFTEMTKNEGLNAISRCIRPASNPAV